jgi:hypothetical protein
MSHCDCYILSGFFGPPRANIRQLTNIAKVRSFRILVSCQHSDRTWLHVDDAAVLVGDEGRTLILQDTVDIQPNMLAAWITANGVRAMNEGGINFDRIPWLRPEEAVLGREGDNREWTTLGDTANGERWIEDDLYQF